VSSTEPRSQPITVKLVQTTDDKIYHICSIRTVLELPEVMSNIAS